MRTVGFERVSFVNDEMAVKLLAQFRVCNTYLAKVYFIEDDLIRMADTVESGRKS